jgi:hypothetical protein
MEVVMAGDKTTTYENLSNRCRHLMGGDTGIVEAILQAVSEELDHIKAQLPKTAIHDFGSE